MQVTVDPYVSALTASCVPWGLDVWGRASTRVLDCRAPSGVGSNTRLVQATEGIGDESRRTGCCPAHLQPFSATGWRHPGVARTRCPGAGHGLRLAVPEPGALPG